MRRSRGGRRFGPGARDRRAAPAAGRMEAARSASAGGADARDGAAGQALRGQPRSCSRGRYQHRPGQSGHRRARLRRNGRGRGGGGRRGGAGALRRRPAHLPETFPGARRHRRRLAPDPAGDRRRLSGPVRARAAALRRRDRSRSGHRDDRARRPARRQRPRLARSGPDRRAAARRTGIQGGCDHRRPGDGGGSAGPSADALDRPGFGQDRWAADVSGGGCGGGAGGGERPAADVAAGGGGAARAARRRRRPRARPLLEGAFSGPVGRLA